MKTFSLVCSITLLWFSSTLLIGAELPRLVIDSGGHMGFIRDVVFTQDGRFLVSGGDDKVIRIWDRETGKTVRMIRGQIGAGDEGKINCLALSPDNKYLAVGGHFPGGLEDRGAIRIYDFESGELLGLLKGHRGEVLSLSFSTDSRRLISGGDFDDKTVRIWSVDGPGHFQQLHSLPPHRDGVFSVAFSIDGERAVSSSRDTEMRLWDVNKGSLIKRITPGGRNLNEQVDEVKFSPDGRYLASGSRSGRIALWDQRTGAFIRELGRGAGVVTSLSFSPDSERLVAATENGKCQVFRISSPGTIQFKHETLVSAVSFSPDGKTLVTAGGGTTGIVLRDAATGNTLKTFASEGQAIQAVGFARDGKSIAFTGMRDAQNRQTLKQSIILKDETRYSVSLGGAVKDPTKYFGAVQSVNGNTLLASRTSTGAGKRVQYRWQLYLVRGSQKKLIASDTSDYRHVIETLTHDGRYAISGAEKGYLTRYQTEKQTPDKGLEFVGHTNRILSLAVSPDSKTLLSGSNDQTMKLWDIESGRTLLTIFVGDDDEWVAWTPEGYYTASLHGDKYIGWHINQGPDKEATFYSCAQFQNNFYRPDVVAEYLETRDIQVAVQRANDRRKEADLKRSVLSATDIPSLLPPSVEITSPRARESTVAERDLIVHVVVRSAQLPITNIKVFLNGSSKGNFAGNSNKSEVELQVKLDPGENTLTVIAFTTQSYSEPEIRKIKYAPNGAANKLAPVARYDANPEYIRTVFRSLPMAQTGRPQIVVKVPSESDITVNDENFTVKAVGVPYNSPITEIKFVVNGKLKTSIKADSEKGKYEAEVQLSLEPGLNVLTVTASDKDSTSEPETINVKFAKSNSSTKPNLIFLGIGISKYQHSASGSDFEDLSFADNDVAEMAAVLNSQNSSQPSDARIFNSVQAEVLTNENATREKILEKLKWIDTEANRNSNNIHVLYLSGHGGMDGKENYYFYSHNHDPKVDPENMDISWRVIMERFTKAPGKAVIFIDTCHAGAFKGNSFASLYQSHTGDFVETTLFLASDANGYSQEKTEWRHGAFTFAVLEGLKGAADWPQEKDGRIDLEELGIYVRKRVEKLEPTQHPAYALSIVQGSTILFSYPSPK